MIIQKFITVTTGATAMAAMLKIHDRVETHGRASLLLILLTNIRKHYFANICIIIVILNLKQEKKYDRDT